jgi:hypothetical protein
MTEQTYASDVALLEEHTDLIELAVGEARVAVAPAYQGRVMTSSLAGGEGASFGWLNAEFIESGRTGTAFDNYGGEDRFWLGPEAGQFGLWFKAGEPFDLAHWRTPGGFNTGGFDVRGRGERSVAMGRTFDVSNYSGTTFACDVSRTIEALGRDEAAELLGAAVPGDVRLVGFRSVNALTNAGEAAWTREGGLLSIWILGQFRPLPRGKVIVPFVPGPEARLGPKATTDYFGEIPADRCVVGEDHVLFTCDGKWRSKIGISPRRARSVAGSFDPDAGVLTVVKFSLPDAAAELPYVNSLWQLQDDPFAGDTVNSYNDGPPEGGGAPLGPFYEIETSSPAAGLGAGESITHTHATFHFASGLDALSALAAAVLDVDLREAS